jgi:crotonobetainyl-CoA hydratase
MERPPVSSDSAARPDDKVVYERRGALARITLNRPAVLNAMDREAYALFDTYLRRFQADPALRVAIVTGAGGRAFSTGSDIKSNFAGQPAEGPIAVTDSPDHYPEITKPLIAAIDGYCVGGGLERALHCDIRIATPDSRLGLPEPRTGSLGGYGLHHLSRMIPAGEALYLQLTGDFIDAEQALRCGLIHEIVPAERLLPRAEEIAGKIMECAPLAIEAIKRTVYFNLRRGIEDSYRFARPLAEAVGRSEDAREGLRAFSEKRKPQWKGR